MTKIKILSDRIKEELCDAKEYAEEFLEFKLRGESMMANRYREMAMDEMKHADYLHEQVMNKIDELSNIYSPTVEMEEMWNKTHKEYVEKVAFIKQIMQL